MKKREGKRSGKSAAPVRPDVSHSDDESLVAKDVWSRSGSKYRVRAIVLLAVNVLLFAGVGGFAFWLRSGVRFAPALDGYWDELAQTFHFGRHTSVSLASFLIEPINVQNVPMQIPILGLLMAALISIPILISILYRFWSSVPFIAVVGFLAVMPWLAITLLVSCIIASVKPFRPRIRFMAALLALVPAVLYLILAWRGSGDVLAGRIDPIDRIKFVAPWVLAIVAAALVFALVLTIARVVDYRPGAITPLLAIMFGLPVALFEFHVGRDELYYQLLEDLNRAHFADINASLGLEEAIEYAWHKHPLPRPRRSILRQHEELKWQFKLATDLGPHQSELARHQAEIAERCDWFLKYFPNSRYAPSALYIRARALDMRVDPAEFRRTEWIRFYDDFPTIASRQTWHILAENRPDSDLAGVALLRLAQLDARAGDIDRAMDKLEAVIAKVGRAEGHEAVSSILEAGTHKGAWAPEQAETSLNMPFHRVLLEAHRLNDLLAKNRDPLYGYDPISGSRRPDAAVWFGLMDLDPRDNRYIDNLERLKAAFPNCQIEDNIDLEIAKAMPATSLKIKRLEKCLSRFPSRDAVPESLFRLGVTYREDQQLDKSEEAFSRLVVEHPDSIWTQQAAHYAPYSLRTRLSEVR